MSEVVPHGAWPSPIDAPTVTGIHGKPGWVSVADSHLWWVEPVPAEGGRVALVRGSVAGDSRRDVVLPAPWNVRSRVHEYGGRPYVVVPSGGVGPEVVFAEFSDQRLYRYRPGADAAPQPLTPAPARHAGYRYVEPIVGPGASEIWCIREEHTGPAPTDVTRAIVAVPLDGSAAADPAGVRVLVTDRHFLACPRRSPDGRQLSWIGWGHPAMPWDSTELRVATIGADGVVGPPGTVAGGPDEAVVQAEWELPDTLLYVSDPDGWWNLHRVQLNDAGRPVGDAVNLCRREEEFGGALWVLGMQWFQPLSDGRVAVVHGRSSTRLGVLDTATGDLTDVAGDHTEWAATLAGSGATVYGVAASHDRPYQVTAADVVGLQTLSHEPEALAPVDEALLPHPSARTFSGKDGREIHASVYPPRNEYVAAPDGELPPYVVFVHGGPTSRAPMVYDLEVAYFTSRGIGVVEVNYGGSTGHGRAYRNRLRESWGVVDVEDCAAVAQALVDDGLADPARLAIRGGSAGGWTTAAALAFTDVFRCGVIMFPILDLAGWRTGETHDFESQYLESLIGAWPATAQRYRDRSPSNHLDQIAVPFLLLQGLEDEICPPVQAERFVAAMAGRGIPHAYLTFEGEQHGFRQKETIVTALEAELSLYAQTFGFEPAGDVPRLQLTT
ncbi:S9 family peptidase [Phytoactinopolyspora mesophila]|uniref:Prolyl oligopeptidase family serine peptidase n=1 Tax=Phytoactinopolyspora mesophila TaxID=2650750 RepID=A0A7K3M7L3_9ACTN|nr:prolyl oligopeptidase family serine peptidase [Phytoactinopolyspora mesophila]NDL59313.1 prolyl oligopeptidase family serine peptidase [Phytoactinopolyspora mesophila]